MTKSAPPKSDYDRRVQGMVSVAVAADKVTRPVFGRHGFVSGALVVDWPAIVGSAVAAYTLPVRIRFPPQERGDGTLEIKVSNSAFSTELQHLEPLILDRINGYFGWKAVSRLKLRHGPIPERKAVRTVEAGPDAPPPDGMQAALDKVEDPALREVLTRLGQRIASRKT